jgi:hypothetical protein
VRLQSDTMFSGLQFSSLIRAGFGVCLELSTFLRFCVRSRSALLAENLFLRKQLAFYQEHQIRPRRLTDAARISLVLWAKFCDWRSVLVIVKPETLIGWHRRPVGRPSHSCGSSKLNAAESLMQEAPPWKAALCMAWSSTAMRVPRSERERLDCQDPGVNLPPILTAKEFGSELEIVRPRLCSGDADHPVAAER